MLGQIDHLPEVRQIFAGAQQKARLGLAELFANLDPVAEEKKALAVGSFTRRCWPV
jgi:hypothetical protein